MPVFYYEKWHKAALSMTSKLVKTKTSVVVFRETLSVQAMNYIAGNSIIRTLKSDEALENQAMH